MRKDRGSVPATEVLVIACVMWVLSVVAVLLLTPRVSAAIGSSITDGPGWVGVVVACLALPALVAVTFAVPWLLEMVRDHRIHQAVVWASQPRMAHDAVSSRSADVALSFELLEWARRRGDDRLFREAAFDLRRQLRGRSRRGSRSRGMALDVLGGGPVAVWDTQRRGFVIQPADVDPTTELLWCALARDVAATGSSSERGGLARGCRSLPIDVLQQLALDDDPYVRRGVAKRVDLPADIDAALAVDEDDWVERGRAERLGYLPVGG